MKLLISLLTLSVAAALPAQAAIHRTVEKSFSVSGNGTIHLRTSGGPITVEPGATGTVKIVARETIHASSDAEADRLLKDLDLKFEQNGNDVSGTAKYAAGGHWGFHFGSWPPVQVEFVATVPAGYSVDLHTSGGGITVGDLDGEVYARTSGGGIQLGKMGGKVDAETSGGGIRLAEARGAARLDTSGGPIDVGRVAGPADLSTSGGGISIDSVEQRVHADTSGGGIRAGIHGPLVGDCELSTSGGGIRVTVDKSAAFRLDAETSGGGVHADGLTITLKGGGDRSRLAGDVNGGGPELKLRSSGGSIHIDAR